MALLECRNLSYGYIDGNRKRTILNGLSYSFDQGKFYTILGPSGSGKTTLLSLIGALEKTQDGQVLYEGRDIAEIGYTNYRRDKEAIVFQQFNLIPYLSALQNVMNVMYITKNEVPQPYKQTALNLLDHFGIVESKATRSISQLSGGEQQRVAIARALATNAKLILADEPTGNLDTATEREIVEIFRSLASDFDCCVIVVTHSDEVSKLSDIRLRLTEGQLVPLEAQS